MLKGRIENHTGGKPLVFLNLSERDLDRLRDGGQITVGPLASWLGLNADVLLLGNKTKDELAELLDLPIVREPVVTSEPAPSG